MAQNTETLPDPRKWVFCSFFGQDAIARLHGGDYFCACCGATDHDEV